MSIKEKAQKDTMANPDFTKRMNALGKQLKIRKLDAMIVWHPVNRLYLTGLASTAGMVVLQRDEEPLLLVDFRYLELAKKSVDAAQVVRLDDEAKQLDRLAQKGKWHRVGFEGSITVSQYEKLRQWMPGVEEWVESGELLNNLRIRKSARELDIIRRAVQLGDEVYERTVTEVRAGMTEWDIRRVLRSWVDRLDAQCESFDCIVSLGPNASKPHAKVTERAVRFGEGLLIDMGVKLDNYCSDLTRVAFIGTPKPRMQAIHDIVLSAQLRAIDAIREGKTGREIDAVARGYIEKKGFGKYFGHGLGHGVGLDIHEPPTLNSRSDDVLKAGMVVTVEPGIYLPGVGGVRIEDVVVVKRDGCEILTGVPKELCILNA